MRRRHGGFDSSVYLMLEVSSFAASALKRVKQKREGKVNSSIMKQKMYIISGYIIALDYRNCIKGTHIATSLINGCFCFACLFPFIIGEADADIALGVKPSLISQ